VIIILYIWVLKNIREQLMKKCCGNTVLIKITLILFFLILSSISYSQQRNYIYERIQPFPDFPSSTVVSILKDSRGFMWFGTVNGLYRFDGYNFIEFQHDPGDTTSLSDNVCSPALIEDKDGAIWIPTIAEGLNRFDRVNETFKRYQIKIESPYETGLNKIRGAYQDSENNIWFAHQRYGVFKYSPVEDTFAYYLVNNEDIESWANDINFMYEDKSQNLWTGTNSGLYFFDKKNNKFNPFVNETNPTISFSDLVCTRMLEDGQSILWISTNKGLIKINTRRNYIELYKSNDAAPNTFRRLNTMLDLFDNPMDKENTLLVFTQNNLLQFNKTRGSFILNDNRILASDLFSTLVMFQRFLDETGRFWFACDNQGLAFFNMRNMIFEYYDISLTKQMNEKFSATSFLEDSYGNVWVGTRWGGLFQYDKNMQLVDRFLYTPANDYSFEQNFIYCLFEDSDHVIWAGNWHDGGIHKLVRDKNPTNKYKLTCSYEFPGICRIGDIFQDSYGFIWFYSTQGLFYIDTLYPSEIRPKKFPIKFEYHNHIRSICQDKHGNVWFASQGEGLFCLKPENRNTQTLEKIQHNPNNPNSLASNTVFSVCTDNEGNLWVGTVSGLCKFIEETNEFICYNRQHGVDMTFIYDMEVDKNNNFWLSTEKDLVRFNPNLKAGRQTKEIALEDGVPFKDIYNYNIYKSKNDRLYVGGISFSGFYRFYTDSLKDNTHIPPVVITDFKVKNESISLDTSVTEITQIYLQHNQNFFSFEFAALDYMNPSDNEYAYQLEGFDDNWIYSDNRHFANYTGVPPGDYIFRIKGSNNDGFWNEEGTSLMISIFPPPWKTWWAYTLYGLFIFTIFYLILRYYLKRQQLLHKLALEHVQTEKLEELDRMKSRFFANISHEFRTPLTLILGPLDKIKAQISTEAKKDLDIMQRNAKRLQNLINQLLSLSKLESGQMRLQAGEVNIVSLINGYVQSFESLAKLKKIEFKFNSAEEFIPLFVDKEKIEKILYNLLSNAFKFTGEGGRIEVLVTPLNPPSRGDKAESQISPLEGGRGVNISISDTGRGIPPDKLEHIFDRFYQTDDNYTKDQEGTGIGLALTKELVELHHGTINVVSKLGKGTTFTVFLPMGKEHLKAEELVDHVEPGSWENPPDQITEQQYQESLIDDDELIKDSKPLLLIVEDNDDLRSYVRSYLTDDYLIIEAIDGEMGLEKAIEKIPDLVISDVMMPKMDGYELCKKLKADDRTNHIPVILLTAKAAMEDKLEGLETEADDFLTKPFDPQELLVRIGNLIRQRKKLQEKYKGRFVFTEINEKEEIISADEKFLKNAGQFVEQNLSDPELSVESFAQQMAMSQSQLYRKLKGVIDLSPNEFIRSLRLQRAAQLLLKRTGNVAEIAYEVGFNNPSYFSECFQKQFGKLPSEY